MLAIMDRSGYRGGASPGGRWGCATAMLLGVPLLLLLLLADAMGDCAPDTSCHHGFWSMVVLPTVLIVAPIGLILRWLVNRFDRRGR
jgi:hypothetical protein